MHIRSFAPVSPCAPLYSPLPSCSCLAAHLDPAYLYTCLQSAHNSLLDQLKWLLHSSQAWDLNEYLFSCSRLFPVLRDSCRPVCQFVCQITLPCFLCLPRCPDSSIPPRSSAVFSHPQPCQALKPI